MKHRVNLGFVVLGVLAIAAAAAAPSVALAAGPAGTIPSLNPASAALPDPGSLFNSLGSQAATIESTISGYATDLFALLVVIDIAWTVIQALLNGRSDLAELFVQMTQKTIVFSLVYWVFVVNGFGIATTIIGSFVQIGTTAGSAVAGTTIATDPFSILTEGLKNAAPSITLAGTLGAVPDEFFATGFSNLLTGLIDLEAMTAVITVSAYAFLAGTLALAIVEAYIVTAAGIIVTGALGSRWTAGIGEKYYSYAVSVGVKLMMVYICIGLIEPLDSTVQAYNAIPLLGGFVALVASIIAYSAPQFAASIISGSSNSSFGQFAGQFAGLAGAGLKAAGGAVSAAGAAGLTARNNRIAGRGSSGKGSGGDGNDSEDGGSEGNSSISLQSGTRSQGDEVKEAPTTPLGSEKLTPTGGPSSDSNGNVGSPASRTPESPSPNSPFFNSAAEIARMDASQLKANVTPEAIRKLGKGDLESLVRNPNFSKLSRLTRLQSVAALSNKQQESPLGKAIEKAARSPFDTGARLAADIGKTIPSQDHGSTGAVSIRVNV
ncbi:MAG: type IV secretion system protein [Vulcanimicrobiaceae bacterium]